MILCASLALSGCATTRHLHGYKVGEMEYMSFEDLDDANALKMVVMFHNVPAETYEESVAKNLTIGTYTELLKNRKSKYLKESGVFEIAYEKINLKKWEAEDLLAVFEALEIKSNKYKFMPVSTLKAEENAERIIHLTSMSLIASEFRGRVNAQRAWGFLGQALTVALGIALSVI
ncbi:MAG: hypothetical protein ACE5JK_06775 [Candidatus Omnitrophota bacterium]